MFAHPRILIFYTKPRLQFLSKEIVFYEDFFVAECKHITNSSNRYVSFVLLVVKKGCFVCCFHTLCESWRPCVIPRPVFHAYVSNFLARSLLWLTYLKLTKRTGCGGTIGVGIEYIQLLLVSIQLHLCKYVL